MTPLLRRIHPVAGTLALALAGSFWFASVTAELLGDAAAIAWVKQAILRALPVMVLSIAVAGASGFRLARASRHPLVAGKRRRMPLIAAAGLLVLIPAAVFLAIRAEGGRFDTAFAVVQGIELAVGAGNIALLALMVRDGRRIARPVRPAARATRGRG